MRRITDFNHTARLAGRRPSRQRRHLPCAVKLAVALVAAATTTGATTTETIAPLAAIGRLDFAGHEDAYHCTATLIAPDRAVTAAHCLEPPATVANVRFRPRVAAMTATETLHLATWAASDAPRDVALLCLSGAARTAPLARGTDRVADGEGLSVVGYAIPAGHGQRHDGCTVDTVHGDGSFVLNCPLRPGQSGAPVLRHTAQGREIVGIVSATSSRQSLAWDVTAGMALPACE